MSDKRSKGSNSLQMPGTEAIGSQRSEGWHQVLFPQLSQRSSGQLLRKASVFSAFGGVLSTGQKSYC